MKAEALVISYNIIMDNPTISKTDFQFVASKQELQKNQQLTKWVGDHDILLYIHEGEIKAISNICRHFGGPVGYHKAQNGVFTCLWHNWQFSCKDGTCLTNAGLSQRQYPVKIEGDKIFVDLLG